MDKDKKELCTIRIMFTVDDDEQAIAAKKKITEALSDVEGIQIQFALIPTPNKGT